MCVRNPSARLKTQDGASGVQQERIPVSRSGGSISPERHQTLSDLWLLAHLGAELASRLYHRADGPEHDQTPDWKWTRAVRLWNQWGGGVQSGPLGFLKITRPQSQP